MHVIYMVYTIPFVCMYVCINYRSTMLPTAMKDMSLDRDHLVQLFGRTRDEWMRRDLAGWLAPNAFYPGTVAPTLHALHDKSTEVYIVTTKQQRFTLQLCRDMAGLPFADDRVLSQTESGRPKSERLMALQEAHPSGTYHFVEDKYATLEKVALVDDLRDWHLYLVDWGYNTPTERAAAEAHPRIRLINAEEYGKLCHDPNAFV